MKKILNIVYFCSSPDSPSGGVKVIIRHSQLIHELGVSGINSCVVFPNNLQYAADWFEHRALIKRDMNFNPTEDFIVIPEIWAMRFGQVLLNEGYRYAIFVQGGYLIFNGANLHDIGELKSVYAGAEVIMSISDDTTNCISRAFDIDVNRIFKSKYSINQEVFFTPQSAKNNIITYMPRRLPAHSSYLVSLLSTKIGNDWSIVPIDNMQEQQVGSILRLSKIFLSFSELEGLPLPPIEAAICGNAVIGYTGEGGKEYWDRPNFENVNCGELQLFCNNVIKKMDDLHSKSKGLISNECALINIKKLQDEYSLVKEINRLNEMMGLLN